MRALAAGLLGLLLVDAARAEERPRVKARIEFSDQGLAASRLMTLELGAGAEPESVPFGDGTATFAVKIVPAAAGSCYLAHIHVIVERPGVKKGVTKAALDVCGDRPAVLEMGPPLSRTRKRLEVAVSAAES